MGLQVSFNSCSWGTLDVLEIWSVSAAWEAAGVSRAKRLQFLLLILLAKWRAVATLESKAVGSKQVLLKT